MKKFSYLCWSVIILLVISLPFAIQAWFKLPPDSWVLLLLVSITIGFLFYRYLYRQTLVLFNQKELRLNMQLLQMEQDKKNIQQQLDILENLVAKDSHTGLWNKSYCQDRLQEELKRAQRYHSTFSALMLDIDNFKNINDNLGHLTGDEYLLALAQILEFNTRISDIVCRIGGDEFFIILPDTTGDKASLTAEKICSLASKIVLRQDYPLTVSIGICDHCEKYDSIEEIIYAADMALYEAKKAGRNQCKTALPKPDNQSE